MNKSTLKQPAIWAPPGPFGEAIACLGLRLSRERTTSLHSLR
jgi:hypothetical protein